MFNVSNETKPVLGRTCQKRMPYMGTGGLAGYNQYITGHKPILHRKHL
jgi:hypothetical protein